MIDTYDI